MTRTLRAIVSISGGKDSTATALLAMDALGRENCEFVFADTGHEHHQTYAYIREYLPQVLGEVVTIRADFTAEFQRRRQYVAEVWPKKGVDDATIKRVLEVLTPTGIPFLDLAMLKGRFPSRKAQFCTQHLKRIPLDAYILHRMNEGYQCQSWRGIRRDESQNRKDAKPREWVAEGFEIVHPIVDWTAQQVVDFVKSRGVLLNPLYTQGMSRVGCFPCINCNKDELREIVLRYPAYIDKIRKWEALVSEASKRGFATFFTVKAEDGETPWEIFERANIDQFADWAKTSHGGKQFDFIRMDDAPACSSLYGLCK